MQILFCNGRTGEMCQYEIQHTQSKENLVRKIRSIQYRRSQDGDWNFYTDTIILPSQKLILSEVMHLLPVFLKYSPLIAIPNGADKNKSYLFFQRGRTTKIFSLQDGKFVKQEAFPAEHLFTVVSANHGLTIGLSVWARELLEDTRTQWESKLFLVCVYRNTIREILPKKKALLATDEEMVAEAIYRLRLLGLDSESDSFSDNLKNPPQACIVKQQFLWENAESIREPIYNEEKTRIYQLGLRDGEQKYLTEYNAFYALLPACIVDDDRGSWILSQSSFNAEQEAKVKELERTFDLLVYYLHDYGQTSWGNAIPNNLGMLYVNRNMEHWSDARNYVIEGTPEVCTKLSSADFPYGFSRMSVKKIGCHIKSYLFRTSPEIQWHSTPE